VTAALLALARVGPLVWIGLPIPSRAARAILAVVLAAAVIPAATSVEGPLLLLAAREFAIGATLGLVTAIPFRAAEAAGGLIDGARRPRSDGEPVDTMRRGWLILALAVFAATGGPALWIDALGESYRALPVGTVPVGGAGIAIEAVGRLILAAIEVAAPALAAMLTAELVIGLVARSAPTLVGGAHRGGVAAARDLAGILAIAATAVALAASLAGGFGALGKEVVEAARGLGG
jgi:type III secretion protein T